VAKRLYLDASVLNRPFDDQAQARIRLETEAFLAILEKIEAGRFELVGSAVLDYENKANPFSERRMRIDTYLRLQTTHVKVDAGINERAEALERMGFTGIDALHLACAEAGADVFLTVDSGILKRAPKRGAGNPLIVLNPVDYVQGEDFSE
jgi:predicted nucleic acid-binding protein